MLHESLWRARSVQKRAFDHSRTVLFTRRLSAGCRHDLAFGGGTSPSRDLQGEEIGLLALPRQTLPQGDFRRRAGNIERAAKSWLVGDDTAAVIHLAHAGLPRPDDPDEAWHEGSLSRMPSSRQAPVQSGFAGARLGRGYVGTVAKLYNESHPSFMLYGKWPLRSSAV